MSYERREKKFHRHQNEQRQSESNTNDSDPRQSNSEKSKRKQNQSKGHKSKVYPLELSKEVAEQVENWKETFQNHGDDNLVVARWKHVYKLIYPEKDVPDLSSVTSQLESPPRKSEPSASSASAPPASRQKAKKRKGSSSPVGEPRDRKRQPVNSESQGTGTSTEDVPTLPRVAKGDGDAGVPLDAQLSLHNNTAHSFQNTDDAAYMSLSLQRDHGVAPGLLINDDPIDGDYWEPSQPPSLSRGGGTSAPPSTVARSEIVPNDLPSPSSAFLSDDYPIIQKIGVMGAVGGGYALDPSQWPVIEEEDFELF
ncbi:hypothetical protein C7999DRAFT_31820 [Corynascus novoguineensis]|uniref:Uncharacterized protein n=1 Tax=Corynascus novoguineensis TaxID=1126955 RepID=A0AAN7HNZ2_9PEZI|nr:hypothetical protein C7999DRAFT_31820 [Corynascus novoguineensis]